MWKKIKTSHKSEKYPSNSESYSFWYDNLQHKDLMCGKLLENIDRRNQKINMYLYVLIFIKFQTGAQVLLLTWGISCEKVHSSVILYALWYQHYTSYLHRHETIHVFLPSNRM